MGKSRKMSAREIRGMFEAYTHHAAGRGHTLGAWERRGKGNKFATCSTCLALVANDGGVVFYESPRILATCAPLFVAI